MNRLEQAQVRALRQWVRVPDFAYGAALMKNLAWRVRHFPQKPLSPKERYLLAGCLYHYRATLGGRVDFPLPAAPPEWTDYQPRSTATQESLL